jgi:hypothetical protein
MLGSTVLEVAIGLVFCFASMALIASSVYEAIASLWKLRASSLLAGVKSMLNDPQFTGLARAIYNNALVNPRGPGTATTQKELASKPSYIGAKGFAVALIEAIQEIPSDGADLGKAIDALPDPQLRALLAGMYSRAEGKLENLQASLASWFDAGMERVSGTYKRRAQLFSFVIAFVIAALFNVDAFRLFRSLWNHPAFLSQIVAPASASAPDALEALKSLPVGWDGISSSASVALLGWVATASSALFGAPFWFDLLQRVVNVRGTGPKPGAVNK